MIQPFPILMVSTLPSLCGGSALPQRIHLDILIGEHAVNYPEVAAKEKLSELQLRVRQLLDQIEQITKEQAYQRVSGALRSTSVEVVKTSFDYVSNVADFIVAFP